MFYLMYHNGDPYSYKMFPTIDTAYQYIENNKLGKFVRPVFANNEYYPQFKHTEGNTVYKGKSKWTLKSWLKNLLIITKDSLKSYKAD